MMPWREIGPYLRELWQRPAGPMNWKNPIRVFAVVGWLVVQGFVLLGWAGFRVFQGFLLLAWAGFRGGQFVAGLPPLLLFFFAAVGWAGWSFVHRPFPPLDEHPILVLVEYHTPNFFDALVVWYYVTPFAVVMLTGFVSVTIWRVWLEGRRSDFASFSKLPPWPLDPKQKAPAIVIGEVHHPVEAREVFNPSWLTIPERGLYTGVAIFGAVGSGKTSACMNPFARQLLGWQAGSQQKRAAALVLEVKGDFCHDIRQILVEAGRGQDYIELGMNARSQWNPLSAWWLDSYSLAYTVSSLLNQLFGKGKEPFWHSSGSSSLSGKSCSAPRYLTSRRLPSPMRAQGALPRICITVSFQDSNPSRAVSKSPSCKAAWTWSIREPMASVEVERISLSNSANADRSRFGTRAPQTRRTSEATLDNR